MDPSTALPPISELCRFLRPNCDRDREPPSVLSCYEDQKLGGWKSCEDQEPHFGYGQRPCSDSEGDSRDTNEAEEEQQLWTAYPQPCTHEQLASDSTGYEYSLPEYYDSQQFPRMQASSWRPYVLANPSETEVDLDLVSTDDDTEMNQVIPQLDPGHLAPPPPYDYAIANREPYQSTAEVSSETSDLYYYATTADSLWAYQSQHGSLPQDQQPTTANISLAEPKKKTGRHSDDGEKAPAAPKPAKKQRRRIPTQNQRKAANIRERRRMFNLNAAFDCLRKRVPTFAYEKNLSRIETLKLAISYIQFMDNLLVGNHEGECTTAWTACNESQ